MARDRTNLSDAEVQTFLGKWPGWALETGMLKKTFAFADFRAARAFVNRVALLAEEAQHHAERPVQQGRHVGGCGAGRIGQPPGRATWVVWLGGLGGLGSLRRLRGLGGLGGQQVGIRSRDQHDASWGHHQAEPSSG